MPVRTLVCMGLYARRSYKSKTFNRRRVSMNRFSTGLCCVMVLAFAAGVSAQTTDWKGFYIGGNAGGVKGSTDAFTSTVFSPTGYFALSSVPAIAAVGKQQLSPRG